MQSRGEGAIRGGRVCVGPLEKHLFDKCDSRDPRSGLVEEGKKCECGAVCGTEREDIWCGGGNEYYITELAEAIC